MEFFKGEIQENLILQKGKDIELESIQKGAILLIDKPLNWTSFDIVKKLRFIIKDALRKTKNVVFEDNRDTENIFKLKQHKSIKIGHAGTLDPLAEGLLIICTGNKTKEISKYQSLDKVYEGEIIIGKNNTIL